MRNRIGLIGAMEEEIELFREQMNDIKETSRAGLTYYAGELFGAQVVLCKSGVGKVNAAICTQILIDDFEVQSVIFTGVAGGVHPDLNIGDIVISSDCLQYDIDASPLGFKQGEIPYASASSFDADEHLVELAQRGAESLQDVQVVNGRVVSGDQFIANPERVQGLYKQFNAFCVEMEGSAVGQTCFLNQVPFVIIRSLSDKADGTASSNFLEFTKLASERSYQMVKNMLQTISA
ncbi:5'-methylthioadenosine/adenosylhomocysteine nucleosidase [Bacillus horti]|uniref:adenosylhomocysteine nucleosidase n=1 Tax=Caldalkalibacillus horti TaxID=77523 RepID=A0ABT9W110_9BACI|nr:5'-methylthioadenosine/adenosylhomocysteine nucleosidase [Bacillus horti]MDQ0166774.1 adenosylhomocysteine nucleosidase [Bacillus horti]